MTSFQLQQRVDQSVMVVKITDFGNYTSWKDVRDVVQSVGRRDNMENDELATASVHLIVSDPKVRVVCVTSDDRHYFTLTYTPPPLRPPLRPPYPGRVHKREGSEVRPRRVQLLQ